MELCRSAGGLRYSSSSKYSQCTDVVPGRARHASRCSLAIDVSLLFRSTATVRARNLGRRIEERRRSLPDRPTQDYRDRSAVPSGITLKIHAVFPDRHYPAGIEISACTIKAL